MESLNEEMLKNMVKEVFGSNWIVTQQTKFFHSEESENADVCHLYLEKFEDNKIVDNAVLKFILDYSIGLPTRTLLRLFLGHLKDIKRK